MINPTSGTISAERRGMRCSTPRNSRMPPAAKPLTSRKRAHIGRPSGSVVVTAGVIPFIGLVAPNVVRVLTGDNLRRAVPMIALLGAAILLAAILLAADLLGRLLIHPYEVPSSNLLSIAGCGVFLGVLLHGRKKWS